MTGTVFQRGEAVQQIHTRVVPGSAETVDRVAGLIADPTRRAILLSFLDAPRPRTVDEVAAAAGVHRTVAFTHLRRLADAGLLRREVRRGRLGKPAAIFSPATALLELHYPARQVGVLAMLLAAAMEAMGDAGVTAARRAGHDLGAAYGTTAAGDVASALAALADLGAGYRVEGDRVVATTCVFHEACPAAPPVVCGLQAGIIEGVLHTSGIACTVEPAPSSDEPCAYRVERTSR